MPSPRRSSTRVACAVVLVLAGYLAMVALSNRSDLARAASAGALRQQISAGQSRISSLSSTVQSASGHLARLSASISGLVRRINRIQADLDAKRAELLKLRDQLSAARTRLAQLQAYEAHAERVLAKQLVASYEGDQPDVVTVVLNAHGFSDLLERLAFAQRIRKQNVQVVTQVKAARRAVAAEATRLGALEVHQQAVTEQVLEQRDGLARTRVSLVQQQISVARFRSQKAGQLASVRGQVAGLQHRLATIEAAQAAAAAAAAAAARARADSSVSSSSGGAAPPAGPVSSAGGFAFPLPKSAASAPGTWSLDQGVDISAPGNTPEYAVCSGTVVLHGIGGFGPWAPVLHCDSAIGGYSYVYYGHAGPANQLPVGTHVGAGQVMSSVGPGIVGISTGPHIEIGFADSSGGPIGGGSASTMMSLLQGSY